MTNYYKSFLTILIPFLLLCGSNLLSAQTIVLSESFIDCEQGPGWTTTVVEGLVDWQFGYIDNPNAVASNSMNGSCFAFFDDEANGGNTLPSIVRLTSPIFNGAAFADYTLDFDVVFRKQENLEHFSVFVFDGTEYFLVEEYYEDVAGPQFNNYQTISLDLSPFRMEEMQIVFQYDDGGDEGWWLGLDNITVYGQGILNDFCDNAIDINLAENCIPANNSTAVFTGTIPSCYEKNIGSLWYRFQSPITGMISIETAATFNDLITIFQGDCTGLTAVGCENRDEHGFIGETHYMNVNSGTTYYIRVNGIQADFGLQEGDFCIAINEVTAFPVPPVNDNCNNAITLIVDAMDCTIGNNSNATFNGPEPTLNLKTRSDIWYSFSATAASLEIKTEADFADVIAVYAGTCNDFTEVAVNEFGQSLLLENLTIGTTYYVQIGGFFATIEGGVCMTVNTPVVQVADNDLCGNATLVTVDGNCVAGENNFAGFDGPSPSCEIFPTSNVWYEFVAPSSGTVQMNTGTTFPHVVSVYSGDCTNFEEILCMENPLYCSGYFTLGDLVPGETYFMQIAAAENEFGYLLGDLCLSIVTVGSPQLFDALEVIMEVNCITPGISVLNVLPTGGQGAYTIEGNTSGDTLMTGQAYFTVVSDAEGCEIALNGIVECGSLPCVLGASLAVTGTDCYNGANGTAEIDTLAGSGPYSISWSTGSTAALQENLTPGIYFVTVENGTGCFEVFSAAVTNPEPIIANASSTGETGQNASDGTATVNPSGGIPPYNYLWDFNDQTTQSIAGLPEGLYTVIVYDANGCSTFASVNVSSFDCMLGVDVVFENISCAGLQNGTISATALNGTGEATYEWSNQATTATLQNLPPGTYSVTVTDAAACQSIATATITEPTPTVGVLLSSTNVPCFNMATGTAELNVTGGTAPYTYDWPGGGQGAVQTTLLAGDYEVTFTDANSCTGTIPVSITQPTLMEASIANFSNPTCFGTTDGQATVFAQGGTPGYSYQWDDPENQISATANNLAGGTYSVIVTDNNQCTSTTQVTIVEPAVLTISIDTVVNEMEDMANGAISVTPIGGTPPYTYTWVLGGDVISTDEDITGLEAAANYRLVITDANGCVFLSQDIAVQSLTSISNPELVDAVEISPNPTSGVFFVKVALDAAREVQVEVIDALGRRIVWTEMEVVSEEIYPFDLTEVSAGVYMVRVILGEDVFVGGVVVE